MMTDIRKCQPCLLVVVTLLFGMKNAGIQYCVVGAAKEARLRSIALKKRALDGVALEKLEEVVSIARRSLFCNSFTATITDYGREEICGVFAVICDAVVEGLGNSWSSSDDDGPHASILDRSDGVPLVTDQTSESAIALVRRQSTDGFVAEEGGDRIFRPWMSFYGAAAG